MVGVLVLSRVSRLVWWRKQAVKWRIMRATVSRKRCPLLPCERLRTVFWSGKTASKGSLVLRNLCPLQPYSLAVAVQRAKSSPKATAAVSSSSYFALCTATAREEGCRGHKFVNTVATFEDDFPDQKTVLRRLHGRRGQLFLLTCALIIVANSQTFRSCHKWKVCHKYFHF